MDGSSSRNNIVSPIQNFTKESTIISNSGTQTSTTLNPSSEAMVPHGYKPCQKAPLSAADFNGENKSQSKEYTLKTTRRTALERELIRNDPFNYH